MPCRCPQCYSLAEYMHGLTGLTYGLPPAPGHTVPTVRPNTGAMVGDLSAGEVRELQQRARRRKASFAWEEDAAA